MIIRYVLGYKQYPFLQRTCNVASKKFFNSKIPSTPVNTLKNKSEQVKLDRDIITLLERLSLVKCDTSESVKILEDSIAFANTILHIDTTNIKPLVTVLEDE